MSDTAITIQSITHLTPDTRSYRCTRPEGYDFAPGQATEVAIDADGWRDEKRPFTFSSTPADAFLEFTIKSYPDHDGVTEQIADLAEGDRFLIGEPWGAIEDRGSGVFIAGGAGITPFLSILRARAAEGSLDGCHLIFSNKTEDDIICRHEFEAMEALRTDFLVTDQPDSDLSAGRLDEHSLRTLIDDFRRPFYVCGPPEMTKEIGQALEALGATAAEVNLDDQV